MPQQPQRIEGLSVVMIVQNAAERLRWLLPRLRFAAEVVVLDGGSRDGTAQVARGLGARVHMHPFDSFALQRNRVLKLAQGPWLLSLDADEWPQPGLVQELRRTLARPRHAAYRVPIRSRIFGRRMHLAGTQDDRPVRLFLKSRAQWTGSVHEVLRVQGTVGTLHHGLMHSSLQDLREFLSKMERYTTAEARQLAPRCTTAPRWRLWTMPWLEVARRLLWKHGWCQGPRGWAFCLLSGVSQWLLWHKVLQLQRAGKGSSLGLAATSGKRFFPRTGFGTDAFQAVEAFPNETLR